MKISAKLIIILLITLAAGFLLGSLVFGGRSAEPHGPSTESTTGEAEVWTCSMHPQIRATEPGKCPICGMDLIQLSNEDPGADLSSIQMSQTAIKLANIQTSRVDYEIPEKTLQVNGKVVLDERRLHIQSAHIPGRIERLGVQFTGEAVSKGQVIAWVYSPELVTAQEELFEARKIAGLQPGLFEAAKSKLRNWKLTDSQIDGILMEGKPQESFPILSDVNGVALNKMVDQGDYIQRGMPVFEIADLSRVWVVFDLYENNMSWVRVGSKVEYSVQAIPGESFSGTVSFIDPVINPQTRVAQARIESPNPGGKLKPEMYVRGSIISRIGKKENSLVIPKSAIMWTGERSIVYVKEEGSAEIRFRLREVILGPSLGDSYLIASGLAPGEEIVTNGTFTVDAAAQLAGKYSMMNPPPSGSTGSYRDRTPPTFRENLSELFGLYIDLKNSLVASDPVRSGADAASMEALIKAADWEISDPEFAGIWKENENILKKTISLIRKSRNLEEIRRFFEEMSMAMTAAIETFGISNTTVYRDYCPMANQDKGAYWLSEVKDIRNPYFGEKMLKCGEVKDIILPASTQQPAIPKPNP